MVFPADRWTPARRREVLRHAGRVSGNVAATCRRFGVSRTTFYQWARRREVEGSAGLRDKSRRPHSHPRRTSPAVVAKIVYLRRAFGYSPEKIRRHLAASFGISISGPGVWKVLRRLGLNRRPASVRHFGMENPRPDERHLLRFDVQAIEGGSDPGRSAYLYSAADEKTRVRVLRTFGRVDPATAILFIEDAIGRLPFRVGTVVTEGRPEWMGYFHSRLTARGIDHVLRPFPKDTAGRRIGKTEFSDSERRRLESGWVDDPVRLFADKLREWEALYRIGR